MNYNILFCGLLNPVFDNVLSLILETAKEADYLINTYSQRVMAPFSSISLKAEFIGSAIRQPLEVVIDFDNVYFEQDTELLLNSINLDVELSDKMLHYWGIAGSLFKIVTDLSPAYITSYLLEKNMNAELALFKKHTMTSLPLKMQKILSEL